MTATEPGVEQRLNGRGPNGRSAAPLTVGVVGLGYWGPNRLRALLEVQGVAVTSICDRDPERLDRFSLRYPGLRATTEIERLLADPDLDATIIATPVHTHHDLARKSLAAGKHTFVEKPLAASSEQAERLRELAAARKRVLMCGHTFLHSPPVRLIKAMLERGELGEIYFISASRVNLGLHQRDVSVVWDLAPHDFSILQYWLDAVPEWVAAVGRDSVLPGICDVAFLNAMYPGGVVTHIELSWLAPSKLRRTVIVGSEKMVVYEDGCPEPVRVFDSGVVYKDPESFGEYQLSYRTGDIVSPRVESTEPIVAELGDFAAAIRTGSPCAGRSEFAIDVIRSVEAAESSMVDGGERVAVCPGAAAPG